MIIHIPISAWSAYFARDFASGKDILYDGHLVNVRTWKVHKVHEHGVELIRMGE
jgi:hypothetical protein